MTNLAILQARVGSTRLPGKVLKSINGKPMIEWQILRIQESTADKIILATSNDSSDDELASKVAELDVEVFRGSVHDVHSRYFEILKRNQPDYFIRFTGDCPVAMPDLLNQMIGVFEKNNFDYLSNIDPPTYPDGLDIEIISTESFFTFSSGILSKEEKEHVSIGMRRKRQNFNFGNFSNSEDQSEKRWTVDYEEDFQFIKTIFNHFVGLETKFNMNDILDAVESGKILDNPIPYNFRNISLGKGENIE